MKDIIRNTEGLRIEAGDIVVGESTRQHQTDIIYAHKAWNHFHPQVGVGISDYLNNTEGVVGLRSNIRYELERDGQAVEQILITKGEILITAAYES